MAQKIFPRCVFLSLLIFTFCQYALTQVGPQTIPQQLTDELNQKFSKFDLVQIKPQAALNEVFNNENVNLQTKTENLELLLTPRNLLASDYRAEATGANGVKTSLPAPGIRTFKGTIAGEENSQLRLTISEKQIEGLMIRNGTYYFIEPAKHFSPKASDADFVIYRNEDLLVQTPTHCDLPTRVHQAAKTFAPQTAQLSAAPQSLRVAEIATEADFQFVQALGGGAAANADILSVLNVVEGIYQNQLGIAFSVTFQHVWTAADPYPVADTNTVLESFRAYWNANYSPNAFPRDTAQLFSGKETLRGRGHAFLNAICRPDVAYGINGHFPYGTAKYSVPAHEIGHNFSATHVDANQSCGNTLMNAQLTTETPLNFCPVSRSEVINFVSSSGDCLTPRQLNKTKFDFDNDSKADFSVFRNSGGNWYFLNSRLKDFKGVGFGLPGDIPVAEDYDGDKIADIAVFRAGVWFILNSSNNAFRAVQFGLSTDVPVPADFTGDGRAEAAVYRPAGGFWYKLDLTNNGFSGAQFGTGGDVPTTEDYDGDGRADISVFRPSTGFWYRINSSTGQFAAAYFGKNGDRPVQADYDGDGKADVAVFRSENGAQANWYILRSSNNGIGGAQFGNAADVPVPADYDGDGRADIAVYRAGAWYYLNSSNGAFAGMHFGTHGDIPIPFK